MGNPLLSARNKTFLGLFVVAAFVLSSTLGAFFINSASAAAASTGTNSGSNFASVNNGAGSYNWTNPGNAVSSNTSYAFADLITTTHPSDYLRAKGFGLSIPAGSIINGIEVQIERHQNCTAVVCIFTSVKDDSVRLVKNGSIVGTDEASGTSWGTSDSIATYGGPSDLWGTTWTVAQINNVNSGMVLSAKLAGIIGARRANVDHITMKVYYYVPTPNAITGDATAITSSDAILNATNGDFNAGGHSIWVSTASFSTATPSIPAGVYSTPDYGPISANQAFSSELNLLSSDSIPAGFPGVTPNTTYYYAAWSQVGGTWYPGEVKSFTTLPGSVTATVTADNKTYDGTTDATISCSLSGVVPVDAGNVGCSGTASFDDKNVGGGKTVTASGITLTGPAAGNYILSSDSAVTTANITPREITVTATHDEKFYDTTTSSDETPTVTAGSVIDGDTPSWSQVYADPNVGTDKTLTPSGTITDGNDGNNYTVTFEDNTTGVINQADAPITIENINQNYDGSPKPVTITTIPNGLDYSISYTGTDGTEYGPSSEAPTNAGSYTVDANITDDNYSGSDSKTLVINKINATIEVSGYTGTYDGDAHGATGTATGVGDENLNDGLNLGSSFTDVPGGTANWTFTGGTNYNDDSGTVEIVINKADADITVDPYTVTYDGDSHTATGSATGVGGESLDGLDLSNTVHTNASTYSEDSWTFTDETGNYNNDNGTITDLINKADASIEVSGYTGTYDGNEHGASGSATGVGEANLNEGLDLGATFTNVPGGTAEWTFNGGNNYNDDSGEVAVVINKATPSIFVSPYTVTFDGSAHTATGTATGVGGEDDTLDGLNLSGTTHTNVGTYSEDSWTFTDGTGNYNNAEGSVSDRINPIPTHTIHATAGNGGSIDPSGDIVLENGANQTFTFTADPGFHISSVTVDEEPVDVGSSFTFTEVTTNHAINVTFAENQSGGGGGGGSGGEGAFVIPRVRAVNGPLTISGDSEGLLDQTFVDGSTIELEIPQGAVSTPVTFTVDSGPSAGFPPIDGSIVGNTFVITAVDADGNPVHSFPRDLSVTITGLHFTDSGNISLYFFDPTTNTFELVTTSGIDSRGTVTFTVNHLTKFALINLPGHQSSIKANTSAQQVLGEKKFADNSLLKDSSDKKVYLLTNNKLKYLATASELAKYKGKTILVVSHTVILSFTKEVLGAKVYAEGTIIKIAGSSKIYVIIKGKMVHITSLAQLKKYKGHKMITIVAETSNGY